MSDPLPTSPAAEQPARRAMLLGGVLLALVLGVFALGKLGVLPDGAALDSWMEGMGDSPWGLPALIVVFCAAAFFGMPQFALIALAVAVFGPWTGAAYAWIATMASGALTFWVGRLAGEEMFRRYAGRTANRMAGFIGRNAFVASAVVRNVPTGPPLMVNMAFGVSRAGFLPYWAGMAIGIVPKILLIAFAGRSLIAALAGNPVTAIATALAGVAVYAAVAVWMRRRDERQRQSVALIGKDQVDNAAGSAE
ncbi:MAG: VTT domain-containing protein [Hyphomonas sp.]|nr:TVP38/TMEM64 family protein [Hyphomonas sp.]MCB9961153.1 TVP38/TMEM64 family protein [Hyphomonas sp.]MCB9970444.1 TVP38/TMEM64 family protein [Hyphomonas sp.]